MRSFKWGEDKAIHVGASHAYEIAHFLRNPVEDKKILDLARRHAHLAEYHPLQYRFAYLKALINPGDILGQLIVSVPWIIGAGAMMKGGVALIDALRGILQ
jgi:hypothetical protein